MKRKLFWLSLLLIGISWVINAFYAQSKWLDEPIFLNHAIHTTLQSNNTITLYYLTNAKDESHVSSIYFNGISGHADTASLQTFPHYVLKQATIELNAMDLERHLTEGALFTEDLEINFSDGHWMTIPIGELAIDQPIESDSPLFYKSGLSADQSGSSLYQVTENMMIDKIEWNLGESFQQGLNVTMETPSLKPHEAGVPIEDLEFPLALEKGDNLAIHWQVTPDFIGFINAYLTVSGVTESEESFVETIFVYSQPPYLKSDDVLKIIEAERAIR